MNGKIYNETPRLLLRQWIEEDRDPFAKLNSSKKVMEFFPKTLSKKESNDIIDKASQLIEEKGYCFWAVELKESSEFIGMIGVNDVLFDAPFTPAVEIGWRLDQRFWRRGLAAEGATAALNFAFSTLKLKEVVAFTSILNDPSMRLMEKIGMRRDEKGDFDHPNLEEGNRLRQHVLYRIPSF